MRREQVPGQPSGDFVVLITAKAPVPGSVKTRLTPPLSPDEAAMLAAAALVDTIEAASAAIGEERGRVVLSMAGQLDSAAWPTLAAALAQCTVIEQMGETFGERLRHAHQSAAELSPGLPVVQIGTDTPQVTAGALTVAASRLYDDVDAVLGPASDGGWWLLGLRSPEAASVLSGVPMSSADTGRLTRQALTDFGLVVDELHTVTDVDTYDDALRVRSLCPGTHFARAFEELGHPPRSTTSPR